jgi:hypothetical protein
MCEARKTNATSLLTRRRHLVEVVVHVVRGVVKRAVGILEKKAVDEYVSVCLQSSVASQRSLRPFSTHVLGTARVHNVILGCACCKERAALLVGWAARATDAGALWTSERKGWSMAGYDLCVFSSPEIRLRLARGKKERCGQDNSDRERGKGRGGERKRGERR